MKPVLFAALAASLALAACGPSSDGARAPVAGGGEIEAAPTGPELSGVGALVALDGRTATIDHEAVEGGLPAGRSEFRAYATVLAEAPLEPGSRVAFKYQAAEPLPVLTELAAR
ncbi:copper-binding protein [Phenylobacterium sp.]|jgi:hypothetical protein|uniref:copper-binding protein n=1 Tax=Phenylobacterium sp. TaxID=1871053 RepID=UPI002FD8F311